MTNRGRTKSLEALESHVLDGYPAVALQHRPRPVRRNVRTALPVVRVLDIQQVPLTRPGGQQVSVLVCNESGSPLALGMVGKTIGLRNYLPSVDDSFSEQVIELDESTVYQRGRRAWFACPGLSAPCGSKRMKLYLPPGESTFACAECHGLEIPHAPDRASRWKGASVRLEVMRWHEPAELHLPKGA